MNIQDILVYIIVVGCIVFAFRHYIKLLFHKKEKASGCGCGCSGCPHKTQTRAKCCENKREETKRQ